MREEAEIEIDRREDTLAAFADVVVMMDESIRRIADPGLGYRIGTVRREHRAISRAIRKLEKL